MELPDPLGGWDRPSEGWLKALNFGATDVVGDFKVELPDLLGGFKVELPDPLGGFKVELPDPLGGFKVELPDPLGGWDRPSEGWLKALNFGATDVVGDFKVELPDLLGSWDQPSEAISKPAREYPTHVRAAGSAADLHRSCNLLDRFDTQITDSGLGNCTRRLFADGHYDMAVFKACVYVENFVKERSMVSDKDGADLMRRVFSANNPILRFNACRTESEKNEQRGYMDILAGVMTGVRNPRAHEHDWYDDPEDASALLLLANHLIRKIRRARRS